MKKVLVLFLLLSITQTSAFAIGPKSTMKKVMDSWIGESIDTVINCWGYPTDEKIIAEKKLYYWNDSTYSIIGVPNSLYGGESTCNRILEVDKNSTVIKWQWTGNNCPAIYFTSKKWVNPNNNPWKKEKTNYVLLDNK